MLEGTVSGGGDAGPAGSILAGHGDWKTVWGGKGNQQLMGGFGRFRGREVAEVIWF